MVDTARRLMQHADERRGGRPDGEPGSEERGGDAVEDQDVGTKGMALAEYARSLKRRERERAIRERDELDPATMSGGQLDEPLMVQVAAGQSTRVAKR